MSNRPYGDGEEMTGYKMGSKFEFKNGIHIDRSRLKRGVPGILLDPDHTQELFVWFSNSLTDLSELLKKLLDNGITIDEIKTDLMLSSKKLCREWFEDAICDFGGGYWKAMLDKRRLSAEIRKKIEDRSFQSRDDEMYNVYRADIAGWREMIAGRIGKCRTAADIDRLFDSDLYGTARREYLERLIRDLITEEEK